MKTFLFLFIACTTSVFASTFEYEWSGTQEILKQPFMQECPSSNGLPGATYVWTGRIDKRLLYQVTVGTGVVEPFLLTLALPERFQGVDLRTMDSIAAELQFSEMAYLIWDADTSEFPTMRSQFQKALAYDDSSRFYRFYHEDDSVDVIVASPLILPCMETHLNAGNLPLSLYRTKNRATPAGLGILRWVDLVGRKVDRPFSREQNN